MRFVAFLVSTTIRAEAAGPPDEPAASKTGECPTIIFLVILIIQNFLGLDNEYCSHRSQSVLALIIGVIVAVAVVVNAKVGKILSLPTNLALIVSPCFFLGKNTQKKPNPVAEAVLRKKTPWAGK